jgi:hypothetical protein
MTSHENAIKEFISVLIKEFELDEDELLHLWKTKCTQLTIPVIETSTDPEQNELEKMKVAELKALCKKHGYPVSGTKKVLIGRILKKEVPKKKGRSKRDKKNIASILRNHSTLSLHNIRRNKYDNYEHAETGFVFDDVSKIVIGKQSDTGEIIALTPADIESCIQYKFGYMLPEYFIEDEKDDLDNINNITFDD